MAYQAAGRVTQGPAAIDHTFQNAPICTATSTVHPACAPARNERLFVRSPLTFSITQRDYPFLGVAGVAPLIWEVVVGEVPSIPQANGAA